MIKELLVLGMGCYLLQPFETLVLEREKRSWLDTYVILTAFVQVYLG
jgi:hypothetical protein